jgi:hypothetical protein
VWLLALLHAAGIVAQAILLSHIGAFSLGDSTVLLVSGGLLGLVLLAGWRSIPVSIDMPLAMLTLGGLGMTLGWWQDLRESGGWCESGALHPVVSWMNAGMLAFGLPAMRWLHREGAPTCSTGAFLLAAPWMMLGMRLGSRLGHLAAPSLSTEHAVLADYALMNAGMLLGMLVVALRISGDLHDARGQSLPGVSKSRDRESQPCETPPARNA